ncbi:carboxypeptidase regulatory-like domain-containing protein [Jatrophihabitans endophyticus]|uniref:carboxypeptidase regulatory-like domain-containing protein n=1 Tax=Jatrophihabitans endophyticus TaxID=1206085 RepID=UPI0009347ADA|nr:fibronectin type III domain-containing protein [Jatrophihabitans endophyticus]
MIGVLGAVAPWTAAGAGAAPAHATGAPARARAVTATAVTAHSLRLSWRNPSSRSFAATQVRVLPGATAPRTIHQGHRVGRFGASRHTATVRDLSPGRRYSFAVFATDGHGHAARAAVVRATTLLAAPRFPRAYEGRDDTVVQWRNPASRELRRVVVRYAVGSAAPTGVSRGTGVRPTSRTAHKVRLAGLRRGTRYAVSIFAVDRAGRASAPAVTRFTTPPASTPAGAPGTYAGRVVDTAGSPLVRADVTAYRWSGDDLEAVSTLTDAAGRYTLTLPAGGWSVLVWGGDAAGGNSDRTGYQPEYATVAIGSGATVSAATVVLEPGAVVTGTVVDTAGHPIAGATPFFMPVTPYVQAATSAYSSFLELSGDYFETGTDGTFTARGVGPGWAFTVCAYGDDASVSGATTGSNYVTSCAKRATTVAAGAVTTLPTLRLTRADGGTVTGRLTSATGRPLAGDVELDPVDDVESLWGGFASAGADGRYRIGAVAAGRYRVCASTSSTAGSRSGWAPRCTARPVTVTTGKTTSTRLALPRGAAVSGTLTGPHGRPVAHAGVDIESTAKDAEWGGGATTDAHGRWTATGLPAGRYGACFGNDGSSGGTSGVLGACWRHDGAFALSAGRTLTGIDTRLAAGGAIAGTVVDAAGKPVAGVVVYDPSSAGVDDLDLDIDDSGFTTTDAHGRFVLGGLTSGTHRVCFDTATADTAGVQGCSARTTVRAGHVTGGVRLRTPATTAIRVRVVDSQGGPVTAVDATAIAPCKDEDDDDYACQTVGLLGARTAGEIAASRLTDGDGVAQLDGLTAGTYAVCLYGYFGTTPAGGSPTGYSDACHGSTFDVAVGRGRTVELTMTLADGGTVSGTVTDAAGKPVPGARLVVPGSAADDAPGSGEYFDGDLRSVSAETGSPGAGSLTGADGGYTVIGVRPGSWQVCAIPSPASGGTTGYLSQCHGGAPAAATGTAVTVARDADTRVDLRLVHGGALAGRVTRAGRGVAADVFVLAGRRADLVRYGEAGRDGRWSVDALPPGDYTVCVVADGYQGQCWRHVAWVDEEKMPPLAKATVVTLGLGATRTGIDFPLRRG